MSAQATPKQHYDVIIIGAGPAGTSAAALLHRAGRQVVVFEREEFPRFVIGESLLPYSMDLLEEAGLLECCQRQGYLVKHGAEFFRGAEHCRFDFKDQFTDGWTYAWQVPRDHFDHVLSMEAQGMGVPFFFRHTVRHAEVGSHPSVVVADAEGHERRVGARFILDASGYGRVLPRQLGLDRPSQLAPRKSVFTHVTGDRRPEGDGEGSTWVVTLAEQAWLWIIPFSNGRTSIGLVADLDYFAGLPDDPTGALRAAIASDETASRRLADMEVAFRPIVIEGYSIGVKQLWGEGYCLVGNAMEFLDPVFSPGVTLALASANLAAKLLIRQLGGQAVDWDAEYAAVVERGVDVFRTYVEGWYSGAVPKVFYAPNPDAGVKAKLCSVLAGYAWDADNPYAKHHKRKLPQLVRVLELAR